MPSMAAVISMRLLVLFELIAGILLCFLSYFQYSAPPSRTRIAFAGTAQVKTGDIGGDLFRRGDLQSRLAGQGVHAFIKRIAGMSFDPMPVYFVPFDQWPKTLPEIDIGNRLAPLGFPASLRPASRSIR